MGAEKGGVQPALDTRALWFRISGFGFRVARCRLQISGFGFLDWGRRFQVSGFALEVAGFGFRVLGTDLRLEKSSGRQRESVCA